MSGLPTLLGYCASFLKGQFHDVIATNALYRPGPLEGRWWNENCCPAWGFVTTRSQMQGAPQEFLDLANEKMATINAAYDRIEKQRGLK